MSYKIVWERHGVYVAIKGIVVYESAFQILQEVVTNPKLKKRNYRIYDLLGAARIEHTADSVKRHAAISKASSVPLDFNNQKIAFVAHETPEHRKLFEEYSLALDTKKIETEFFDNLKEARFWAMR